MDAVENKLRLLEEQRNAENDGKVVFSQVSAKVKSTIFSTIESANQSESIDKRIELLVEGLQNILNYLNEYQTEYLRKQFVFESKISVLEEGIDDYIKIETNENEQE